MINKTTKLIIYTLILLTVLMLSWCKNPKTITEVQHDTIVKTEQVTVVDTLLVTKLVPKTIVKTVTQMAELTKEDSARIAAEFFETKSYSDTLLNDHRGIIRIDEQVTQNSIINRQLYYTHINTKEIKTVVTTNTVIQPPTWDLFAQVLIVPGLDNISVTPGLILMNPKGYGGGFHYDVVGHTIGVSFMYKLF